jgi:hypothetical protein
MKYCDGCSELIIYWDDWEYLVICDKKGETIRCRDASIGFCDDEMIDKNIPKPEWCPYENEQK